MKIEIVQHQYNTRRVAIAGSPQQARIHDFAKGVPSKQEGRNFFLVNSNDDKLRIALILIAI